MGIIDSDGNQEEEKRRNYHIIFVVSGTGDKNWSDFRNVILMMMCILFWGVTDVLCLQWCW